MDETYTPRRTPAAHIIAVLAAAVCLLTVFGGIGARPAYAAEDGNIAFSVPAKVPFAVKADGTAVGPSASAWRIGNEGTRPLRMRDVAASGFEDGSSVKAVSEAMPVAGTSSRGIWSVSAGRGGASLTPSTDGTIEIPVGGSAGFTWNVAPSDSAKHNAGPAPTALGSVSFTLAGADRVAFAVYSADDGSLDFYKRMDVPAVGDTFEGKAVTAVYTGFENDWYEFVTTDSSSYGLTDAPWAPYLADIKTVRVADDGIAPSSMRVWFADMTSLESVDLAKLDTSRCVNMSDAFFRATALTSLDLSGWDVSNVNDFGCMFQACYSLRDVDLQNWEVHPKVSGLFGMFFDCASLESLDLSGFDPSDATSANKMFGRCVSLFKVSFGPKWKWVVFDDGEGTDSLLPAPSRDYIGGADGKWYSTTTGQGYAPADIPAGKTDTYVASRDLLPKVAFAVYSADDGSLDFYKRAFCDVPAAGDAFEGKTATEVYTGFEDTEYHVVSAGSDGNNWDLDAVTDTPWFGRRKDIKTVQVVDGGIKPKSVQSWFQGFDNATYLLVAKLDVSACASFSNTFANCRAATSIDVSRWSAKPADMTQMFYMCESVPSLDLSGFDGSRNITLNSTFHACFALDDIKFGDKWTTEAVENFNCAFFGTKFRKLDVSGWNTSRGYMFRGTFGSMGNLEEIDISGWTNAGAENEPGILSTFGSDTKLRTVTVGTGWNWSKSNAKLPAISGEDVAGADGKWYAASDGAGYAPADIPSGKADTYYSVAPSTFAVFSTDDGSLDFYNRAGRPVVGDTWQGKSVDGMYTGFETASYDYDNSIPITDGLDNTCSTPWYSVKDSIKQVGVVDSGIKASSLRCWFANMLNVETVDIRKLEPATPIDCTWTFINCRKMTSVSLPDGLTPSLMSDLFYACMNLTSDGLSMPNLNMSSCTRSFAAFLSCYSLTSVPGIENWNVRNVRDFRDMFANCENLTADLSLWDVSSSSSGSDLPRNFNSDAPGVILPKPWQPTAFAVFSADDGSLDFYKREYGKMPKAGDMFEGKAATEVYTGFEGTRYSIQTSDDGMARDWTCKALPWWDRRDSVKTATVVDTGIAPTSICGWFMRMPNLTAADLSNLDCSGTYTAWCAFLRCTSLTSLKSPMNFNPIDLSDFVYYCYKLKDLDTSSWNMGRCTNIGWAFADCDSLETLPGAESWDTSSLNYADGAFAYCDLLKLDCSNWNVTSSTYNVNFNQGAPYITLPKAWQTASADIASGGDGVAAAAEAAGGGDVGAGDGPVSESPSSADVDNSLA